MRRSFALAAMVALVTSCSTPATPPAPAAGTGAAPGASVAATQSPQPAKRCWTRGPREDKVTNGFPSVFAVAISDVAITVTDNGGTGLAPGLRAGRAVRDRAIAPQTQTLTWEGLPQTICDGDAVPVSLAYTGSALASASGSILLSGELRWYFGTVTADQMTTSGRNQQFDSVAGTLIKGDGGLNGSTKPKSQYTFAHPYPVGFAGPPEPFRIAVQTESVYSEDTLNIYASWLYTAGGTAAPVTLAPTIFIPGVTGSQLRAPTGEILWPPNGPDGDHNPATTATRDSMRDAFRRLSLKPVRPPLAPHEVLDAVDVIRTTEGTNVYGLLLTRLIGAGYREYRVAGIVTRRTTTGCDLSQKDATLFVFAYDWRLDNADSALALADYVGCIAKLHPNARVNIVAHSMGGLVARRYIIDNPGKVDRLISIASPFLGSAKPLYQMIFGTTGITFTDDAAWLVFGTELKEMLSFFPGVHQLMASRAYYDLAPSPYQIRPVTSSVAVDQTFDQVMGTGGIVETLFPDPSYNGKNPAQSNRDFHSYSANGNAQDDWSKDTTGVRYFHLVGVQTTDATPVAVVETGTGGSRTWKIEPPYGPGDGTVPRASAARSGSVPVRSLNAPTAQIVVFDKGADALLEHTGIVGNVDALSQVVAFLRLK